MKKQIAFLSIAVLLVIAFSFVYLYPATTGQVIREEPIALGFIAPLSGELSNWGESMRVGVELAAAEINAKGGINGEKLVIHYEDDQCDEANTILAYNKLVTTKNVEAIIGPLCSGTVLAVAPLSQQDKVILFSPVATATAISEAGDYVFRNSVSNGYQGEYLGEVIQDKLDLNFAAVIYVNNDYGNTLSTAFTRSFSRKGGEVLLQEAYNPDTTDFKGILTKIKAMNPDALIVISYGREGGIIARQAKELGLAKPIIGSDNFGTEEVVETAGNAIDGSYFVSPGLDESYPLISSFVGKHVSAYGSKPAILWASANAYDAVYLISLAIQSNGHDADSIKEYLYQVKGYQGVGGITAIDKNGDVDKPLNLMRIEGGEFSFYE